MDMGWLLLFASIQAGLVAVSLHLWHAARRLGSRWLADWSRAAVAVTFVGLVVYLALIFAGWG